jgi:hypothetical protein
VTLLGPAPQSPGRESLKALIVSSGPVTLDIRPLTSYQEQLIDIILSLRSVGWTDSQIAAYLNDEGVTSWTVKRFYPELVFGVIRKTRRRLGRAASRLIEITLAMDSEVHS